VCKNWGARELVFAEVFCPQQRPQLNQIQEVKTELFGLKSSVFSLFRYKVYVIYIKKLDFRSRWHSRGQRFGCALFYQPKILKNMRFPRVCASGNLQLV
jgi:hypothetical protein